MRERIRLYKDEIDDLKAIAISRLGETIAVVSEDSIFLFDLNNGDLINQFKIEIDEINDVDFSPDGKSLLIAGNDNRASIWTLKGKKIKEFSGILNDVDQGGINYDPNNWTQVHIAKHVKYKNDILLNKSAEYLLRGKVGKKARLWEVATGKTVMEFIGHEKAVLCFDLFDDEKQVVTGGGAGNVILWDVATGKKIREFKGYRDPVFDVQISNDQTKIATCSWDGYVIVWDIITGERLSRFYLGNVSAYNLSFSPNDVYLILAKLDKTLELWEIDSKPMVKPLVGHTDVVTQIKWMSDDEFITTGKEGASILWDFNSGLIKRKYKQQGEVYAVASFGEGKIITGGASRDLMIWNKNTGKLEKTLVGHQAAVTSI